MTTEPRAAPSGGRPGPAPPRWAAKPVGRLTTAELADALAFLERHRPDDDVLCRALASEFARRTAAAEFARRTAAARPSPPSPPSPPPPPHGR